MQNNKNKIGDVMENIEEFNRKKEILIRNRESALQRVEKAKEKVLAYVKDLLVLTDGEKEFLSKLKDKTYVPELLFDNKEIVSNIKHHPASLWRIRENNN